MGLATFAERLAAHRRAMGLVGLLVAFTGVSMILNPTHAVGLEWVGLPLLVVGAALFAWVVWPAAEAAAGVPSLGARLIHRFTAHGRLIRFFPVFGVALIVADLAYNLLLSSTPALLTEDILVLLSAATLLAYGFVPASYARERDFVLLFFFFLDLILVVPLLATRLATHSIDASVDVYSWTALAPEVSGLLSLLGVPSSVQSVAGFTAPGLTFTPQHMAVPVTLVITTSCSGIYSFGIFAAAFLAFVVTEYANPSRRLWAFLALGFAASYVANLLRMAIIVLVGYYTDSAQTDLQNMLVAHSYAGWVIFLAWLALFWGVLFKVLPLEKEAPTETNAAVVPELKPRGGRCGICQEALSPAIPARRCACGAFYHLECLTTVGRCPVCGKSGASTTSAATGSG